MVVCKPRRSRLLMPARLQASLVLVEQGLADLGFLRHLTGLQHLRIAQPSFDVPDLDPISCLSSLSR